VSIVFGGNRYAILALQMRIKLVILTSLIAALIGAVVSAALIVFWIGTIDYTVDSPNYRSRPWFGFIVYLPPIFTALLGAIFVYRHTAAQRKLQAILTAAVVLMLYAAALALLISRTG